MDIDDQRLSDLITESWMELTNHWKAVAADRYRMQIYSQLIACADEVFSNNKELEMKSEVLSH